MTSSLSDCEITKQWWKSPKPSSQDVLSICYLTALAPSTLERNKRLLHYCACGLPQALIQILTQHPKLLSANILYSLHAINYCQCTSHCDMHLHNLSVYGTKTEKDVWFFCAYLLALSWTISLIIWFAFACMFALFVWVPHVMYSYIIMACGTDTDSMSVLLSWVNLSGS